MFSCPLCKSQYQHGPHRYGGHKIQLYDIMVCDTCWRFNWDGWNSKYEPTLLKCLEDKKLPIPTRLLNGLLPRE